jgi:hypothetical protein
LVPYFEEYSQGVCFSPLVPLVMNYCDFIFSELGWNQSMSLLLAKLHPNFTLKNMILSYRKDFFIGKKNEPNLSDFEEFVFQIARFL